MWKRSAVLLGILLTFFGVTKPSAAAIVQGTARGYLTKVQRPDIWGVDVGDPFSVTYTYDSSASDESPADPLYGSYQPSVFGFTIRLGSELIIDCDRNTINVANDYFSLNGDGGFTDALMIGAARDIDIPFLPIPYPMQRLEALCLEFRDTTCSALNSDALPSDIVSLADWTSARFSLRGVFANPDPPEGWPVLLGRLAVEGTIIEISDPRVVPEPTTLVIWSALGALGIIIGWRRRNPA